MDVHTSLHLCVHYSRLGTRYDTPTRLNDRMHHLDEIEYDVIWKRLWALVIEVHEKLEHVSLLFNHVQFFAEADRMYALYVKFVKLFVRNLKNPTIHKDVSPWALVCEPFFHNVSASFLFIRRTTRPHRKSFDGTEETLKF